MAAGSTGPQISLIKKAMNFPINMPATALWLLCVSGSLTADPLDEQMTFTQWTGGTFRSEWPGVTQRT